MYTTNKLEKLNKPCNTATNQERDTTLQKMLYDYYCQLERVR